MASRFNKEKHGLEILSTHNEGIVLSVFRPFYGYRGASTDNWVPITVDRSMAMMLMDELQKAFPERRTMKRERRSS